MISIRNGARSAKKTWHRWMGSLIWAGLPKIIGKDSRRVA